MKMMKSPQNKTCDDVQEYSQNEKDSSMVYLGQHHPTQQEQKVLPLRRGEAAENEKQEIEVEQPQTLTIVTASSTTLQATQQSIDSSCYPRKVEYGEVPRQWIRTARRYLIRGSIVIDFDQIGRNDLATSSAYKDFRVPLSVESSKEGFYEVEYSMPFTPISDFAFLITMLNNLGNYYYRKVALLLEAYKEQIRQFDEHRRSSRQQQKISFSIEQDLPEAQKLQHLNPRDWRFEDSVRKAKGILKDRMAKSSREPVKAFIVNRSDDNKDYIQRAGFWSKAVQFLFGNISKEDAERILIHSGNFLRELSLQELIEQRCQEMSDYLTQVLGSNQSLENFSVTTTQYVKTITQLKIPLQIRVERVKLTDFPETAYNDYLLVITVPLEQIEVMRGQMWSRTTPERMKRRIESSTSLRLLQDMTYSLESEYFVEKFYTKVETGVNLVPTRINKVIEKKNKRRKAEEIRTLHISRVCKFRYIDQSQQCNSILQTIITSP